MKVAKSIGLFFLFPLSMFLIGAFSGIVFEHYFYPGDDPEVKNVSLEEKQVLTSDTQYIMVEADLLRKEEVEIVSNVPEHYIGLDRDMFVAAMDDFESSPPLHELERGLIGVEVKSFSNDRVVIQKNYYKKDKPEHFYLTVQDNYVVVMCEDLLTIYMNTTISLEDLPDRIQTEIVQNKYIESEKELYDFLETYSS